MYSSPDNLTRFYCFSHPFSSITFFFFILVNFVWDESFREILAPISPKGQKVVAQIDFCVYFCNILNLAKLSLLLTGKFRRGVTERVHLKRILTSGEYRLLSWLYMYIT